MDIKDNIAMITLHNVKRTYRSVMEMKRELQKNERDKTKQYWNMVSLLSTVLDHNNLSEAENQDNIIFFTKQMYLQLQKNYPEYGITDEEVEAVSHLAPIHDIGKIRVPVEILNKNGRLTEEEMEQLFGEEQPEMVIDATHPYADLVSENIRSACENAGKTYLRLLRPSLAAGASCVMVGTKADIV